LRAGTEVSTSKMTKSITLRKRIENNGLILIALMMVLIFWVFDTLSSGPILTRTAIAALVIIYGIFTQGLINSRKQALEEKERTQQQLIQTEKLAALGSVAAGVAHEVKNPLAIIVQGVEYLKKALHDDARLSDVAERIEKSTIRADNIIKALLGFARQVAIKTEEADIAPLIDETLLLVDHQINRKHIRVETHYAPGLPQVVVDSSQIRQVLINLFMNAIEAMSEGGVLGIRTGPAKDEDGQPLVQVFVSDTGEGVPEDRLQKVFDPFFTTKNAVGNTGLGLSISKGIIDRHQGTIVIESEVGRGTRVTIGLPARRIEKSASPNQ
jgi:two-component system NtrC family sensor kinase